MENNKRLMFAKILLIIITIILLFLLYYKVNNMKVEFSLKGDKEIEIEIGDKYKEPGFTAMLNGKEINDQVSVKSNIQENKLGSYKVVYNLKVAFLNIDNSIERKVNVVDKTEPILTVNSNDEVTLNMYDEFVMPTYEAYDNVDGIITDKIQIKSNLNTSEEGKYQIVYTVYDSSKNKAEKIITVKVEPKYKNSYIEVSISNQKLHQI